MLRAHGTHALPLVLIPLTVCTCTLAGPIPNELKHDRDVSALAISADGNALATATGETPFPGRSGTPSDLWLWDMKTRRKLRVQRQSASQGLVQALAFSPDGSLLAVGGSAVDLLKVSDGKLVHHLAESRAVKDLAFSRDGSRLAAADADGSLSQWDVRSGRRLRSWKASDHYAFAVAYEASGKVVVTGGDYDGRLTFWNADTGRRIHTIVADANTIDSIAFAPDGRAFATGSWHSPARLWDTRTRKLLHTLRGHTFNIWRVAFSPNGRLLASVSSELKIWDVSSGRLLRTIPNGGMWVAFTGDSKSVLIEDGSIVRIWNLGSTAAH